MNKIISWCKINLQSMELNDQLHQFNFQDTNQLVDFLIKAHQMDYPKIYKMDILSKLCLIGSELLLKNNSFDQIPPYEKSIVLLNRSSCFNADISFQQTIADAPSPSKFVYTLPNIAIGEIAIKHQIKGFTNFIIAEKFDPKFVSEYFNHLLDSQVAKSIIGGWVEVSEQNCDMFLFLCGKSISGIDLTEENLKIKSKL